MEREFAAQLANPNYMTGMSAKHFVSDALLSKAFGASPLLFQHAETSSDQTDDETNEIEMLKRMSVGEILNVIQGKETPTRPHHLPPLRQASHANIWPPLPKGPPPPLPQSTARTDCSHC
jgi:hypothetical protein